MTQQEHDRIMTFAYFAAMLMMMVGIFIMNGVIYYRSKKRKRTERKRIEKITKNKTI